MLCTVATVVGYESDSLSLQLQSRRTWYAVTIGSSLITTLTQCDRPRDGSRDLATMNACRPVILVPRFQPYLKGTSSGEPVFYTLDVY